MVRPRSTHPTPAELDVLKVLWRRGASTVREVMDELCDRDAGNGPPRAYTSVMSLMNVMDDKGLLRREPQGRAFLYHPAFAREKTLGTMVDDLLGRAFDGSASLLVARLLDQSNPTTGELEEIRAAIDQYRSEHPESEGNGHERD